MTAARQAAALSILAVAAICQASGAAERPRQTASLTYTTTIPGAPTGLTLEVKFQNPDDPALKPHSAATMVVHRAPGGVIDTTMPAQCRASNAELMARGPEACPPESKVGTAVIVSDTGSAGPFPRYSTTHVTDFNNQDEIVAVGENEDLPLRPVDRTRIEGNKTTTNFPTLPGQPPPDPYTAMKTIQLMFPPYIRDGRAYNRTPPTCPPVGYWTTRLEFTYRDGITETVESRSPCARAKLRIGHRDVVARRRATVVELRCAGPRGTRCSGSLTLEATPYDTRLRPAGRGEAQPVQFALEAGRKQRIRAPLPARTAAAITRRGKAVVRAVARLEGGGTESRLLSVFSR
ncbi:MAG: hypothetical protein M3340_00940 [Actinomycetota bacterium]|nr:hypothetical protein [Actinomycetota bacterium]